MKLPVLVPISLLPLLLGGCASLPWSGEDIGAENAREHLQVAEEEIERGELEEALERLVAVRAITGLSPEDRYRSEGLIDRCAELLMERYSQPGGDLDRLEDLYEEDLSPRLRAKVGVRYAERLLEEGSRVSAYKQIKQVEEDLPSHTERAGAGDVLAAAGLSLAQDEGRYWLILSYRNRGIDALEYLVVTYPMNPRCPEAYAALAQIYEDEGDLDLAIERHEYLLLYHPDSPQAVHSEARLPYLRLSQLDRADNDRGEMTLALREIHEWQQRHPGHELEGWVRQLEKTCLGRLAENDLYLARYYDRIDNVFGARMHTERALDEAVQAEAEALAEEARTLLGSQPAAEVPES